MCHRCGTDGEPRKTNGFQHCSGCTAPTLIENKPVPHKHAEVIKAWADGAQIQEYSEYHQKWNDIGLMSGAGYNSPILWNINSKYRIKPEPRLDVVRYINIPSGEIFRASVSTSAYPADFGCIKCVFDGETHKLKSVEKI